MLVPGKPSQSLHVRRYRGGRSRRRRDVVTVEEPLEIRLRTDPPLDPESPEGTPVSVTMRTPGHDFDLSAGFLRGEGIVTERAAVASITYCRGGREAQEYNVVEVRLGPGVAVDPSLLDRNFYMTSSCGVCGKATLDAVEVAGCVRLPPDTLSLSPETVASLPERMLEAQESFARTGGLHAAGLFRADGSLDLLREDVGRHNAVDKVVGKAFLDGRLPLHGGALAVSGRASFEIVQKAVVAGIPLVAAVGAPSSLAVDLAQRFGLTLAGFVRDGGFNVYAGDHRIG